MSGSPFLPQLARRAGARRLTLILSLLLITAAVVPFVTRGARGQSDSAPQVLRRASAKSEATRASSAEFVPGHVLVRFRSEAAAARAEASPTISRATILDATSPEIAARVERFEGSDLVRGLRLAYVEPAETLAAIEAFKSRTDVLYAEPDYVRRASVVPNDTNFATMWAMRNTGQLGGTVGADIKATQAWDITTGSSNVVVGVIDEGIDISHPDLAANIWTNPGEVAGNGVDDDGNGKIDDVHGWDFSTCTGSDPSTNPACGNNTVYDGPGNNADTGLPIDAHGTHVAGTIGAVGNNSTGVVGVNWNVKILPLKFLSPTSGAASNAIRAEAYAKALRDKWNTTGGAQGANVRVLSNSYGGGGSSQAELDSITAVGASGILFVVAAGNESSNNDIIPTFPSSYVATNLISVAATNRVDQIDPNYSNYGPRTVHIAAPGTSIISTFPGNTYSSISGTSMATPHVSGVAALVLAANPNLTVQQLRSIVLYNGDANATNFGNVYSLRRLNAFAAVQAAQENDTTAPAAAGNLHIGAQNGRAVTLSFTAPGDDGNTGRAALYEISYVSAADGTTYVLKTALPNTAGTAESVSVNVPLRQTSGTLRVKTIDNVGNTSLASVAVSVPTNSADPYLTSESAFAGLATLGTALNFHKDDNYTTYALPSGFSFPYFGQSNTSVVLSSNGNLYLQPQSALPPANDVDEFGDSGNSTQQLEGFRMISGLWDDLRTDCSGNGSGSPCDVYVNTTDPNKVIFRWEARTFNSTADAGNPVEFEIELDRDGTILTRYGAGNTGVFPLVGIGAGEQGGSYVINSHTSLNAPISLTNAPTVTFAPRPTVAQTTLQFSATNYPFNEAEPSARVVVTRAGDTSAAVSVDVRTVDDPAAVACNVNGGVAYARCDYETTLQTVTFAAGDAQPKTVSIPLVNDTYLEQNETFQVTLLNPTGGATTAAPATATVTIVSEDPPGQPNPMLQSDLAGTTYFVRQQYLDFLSREPEPGEPWTNVLRTCGNGTSDQFNTNSSSPLATCDRISVSSGFFRSPEFEFKGRFIFNFYKSALNRLPLYSEIIGDMSSITAGSTAEVQARKAAFTNAFVQKTEFKNLYDALTNTQFVNTIMDRYAPLPSITTPDPLTPDSSTKITLTRADLINHLNGSGVTYTRAQVVRAIADSNEVGAAEFNSGFVAMQYYGYLRRDPEPGGYADWLRTINANPADVRSMINGFMNSPEYRLRFGTP
jgi:subtilisin family serine protease